MYVAVQSVYIYVVFIENIVGRCFIEFLLGETDRCFDMLPPWSLYLY